VKSLVIALIISTSALFANGGAGGFDIGQLVPPQFLLIVSIFAVFYFLMIRPQQKKAKAHQEMLKALHRGDHVVTAGGILGTVDKVSDNEISLEIANNVKIRVVKATVTEVLAKTRPVAETAKSTPAPKMSKASDPVKKLAVSKAKPAVKPVEKKATKPAPKKKQKSKK